MDFLIELIVDIYGEIVFGMWHTKERKRADSVCSFCVCKSISRSRN